jgi:rhodanese-related sulfurtransferase
MARPITPDSLRVLMDGDELHAVLDVRPRDAYVAGQIFRSTTVPRDDLAARLPALGPVRTVRTILVGADDTAGREAAALAEQLGYANVEWLAGGYAAWADGQLPTITGWSVPGKDFGERLLVQEPVPEIEPDELADLQARGAPLLILDSRTPAESTRGCIPGGRNVPGGELPLAIGDLMAAADPQTTVVVNCAGRTRSILGAFQLQRMGVPNVRALRNGTMGWLLSGRETQRGADGWGPDTHSAASTAAAEQAAARIAAEDGVQLIAVDELRDLQARADVDPLYVVDVRMPAEYLAGHIPGALTCPGGQVAFSDDQIAVRGATIVTVCDARARAIFAASLWRRMGFPRVCALDGGITAWTAAGLSLEPGGEERPFGGGGLRTREEMLAYLEWEEELGRKYER